MFRLIDGELLKEVMKQYFDSARARALAEHFFEMTGNGYGDNIRTTAIIAEIDRYLDAFMVDDPGCSEKLERVRRDLMARHW